MTRDERVSGRLSNPGGIQFVLPVSLYALFDWGKVPYALLPSVDVVTRESAKALLIAHARLPLLIRRLRQLQKTSRPLRDICNRDLKAENGSVRRAGLTSSCPPLVLAPRSWPQPRRG
jgi:hypothetical protein